MATPCLVFYFPFAFVSTFFDVFESNVPPRIHPLIVTNYRSVHASFGSVHGRVDFQGYYTMQNKEKCNEYDTMSLQAREWAMTTVTHGEGVMHPHAP